MTPSTRSLVPLSPLQGKGLISIRLVFPACEDQACSADGESGCQSPTHLALDVAVRRSSIQALDLLGIHGSLVVRVERICFIAVLKPLPCERGAASHKDDTQGPTNCDDVGQLGGGGYIAECERADEGQQKPGSRGSGGIENHRLQDGGYLCRSRPELQSENLPESHGEVEQCQRGRLWRRRPCQCYTKTSPSARGNYAPSS